MSSLEWPKWLSLGFFLFIGGCASFAQIDLPREEIRNQIADGKLIVKGDYVKVVTLKGDEYRFVVEDVTPDRLVGGGVELQISNIKRISKGTPSVWTKAAAYTSAFTIGFLGMAALGVLVGALLL